MKLKTVINDQEQDVKIEEIEGKLRVEIGDRHYELEVNIRQADSYLILNHLQVYDCRVQPVLKTRDRFVVTIHGKRHSVAIIDPRRLRTDENSDRHHHGPTEITAQMPGKVVRVLVEAGTQVDKGTGIVVVEAMKMQNEMKSPRAGIVASINVKAGDTVNAGEVLASVGEADS